jgi:hypothetical protein
MITYEDVGIRVAESWWDEIVTPAGVDLLRLLYRREAADGDRISRCPTFRVSVRVVENPLRGTLDQLMYAFEPEMAGRVQRGLGLKLTCRVNFHPSRPELEQFVRFVGEEARRDGCSPAGVPRLAALSDARAFRLSMASDRRGRVLAQHGYLRIGDRARLLDGACARAADTGSPEDAEVIQCADPLLLYWDMVTLYETDDVKMLDLPVLESAGEGIGLRGRSLTLYSTERVLSPAGRHAIGEP